MWSWRKKKKEKEEKKPTVTLATTPEPTTLAPPEEENHTADPIKDKAEEILVQMLASDELWSAVGISKPDTKEKEQPVLEKIISALHGEDLNLAPVTKLNDDNLYFIIETIGQKIFFTAYSKDNIKNILTTGNSQNPSNNKPIKYLFCNEKYMSAQKFKDISVPKKTNERATVPDNNTRPKLARQNGYYAFLNPQPRPNSGRQEENPAAPSEEEESSITPVRQHRSSQSRL